jgi:MFS family permease
VCRLCWSEPLVRSVYAWSIFNEPLTRIQGVIASSSGDWSLSSVVPIFSACAITLGLCTFGLGKWAERVGPRAVAATASLCWSSGLVLTGVGCLTHTLPLAYLGYGALGGAGWALGYISPVSNLIKWFPDRRGLAAGMALTAFGGGAMVATPVNEMLMKRFFRPPEMVGSVHEAGHPVIHTDEMGRRVVEVAGEFHECIVASAKEVTKFGSEIVEGGIYLVGTGDSGVASTFFALSAGYFAAMITGALLNRVPPPNYHPETHNAPEDSAAPPPSAIVHREQPKALVGPSIQATSLTVDADRALRLPQFYLLWAACAGNAIGGVTVISCAKTLMSDCFATALPTVVTGTFAATYVAALSLANMAGRLGWASASDVIGRKNAYFAFALGAPLCLYVPYLTGWVSGDPSLAPLVLFFGSTWLIVSFYGGVFSVLPAYIADLFGQQHVGAIHGRLLTAWSGAALTGPLLLSWLRERSLQQSIVRLTDAVDPVAFEEAFGMTKDRLADLVAAKTVTIPRLMELLPPGFPDPTPTLYDSTMYSMAGILAAAAVANAALRNIRQLPATSEGHEKKEGAAV